MRGRRLGKALAPIHVGERTTGQAIDIDANPVVCASATHTVSGSPRTAHGEAAFFVFNGAGTTDVAVHIVESTDGGTWNPASPSQAVTTVPSGSFSRELLSMMDPRDLAVGTGYRYALRVGRVPGSASTGDVGLWQCHLRITLENRNGSASRSTRIHKANWAGVEPARYARKSDRSSRARPSARASSSGSARSAPCAVRAGRARPASGRARTSRRP